MSKYKTLILATAVASLGGFLFGYDTGVINGTQLYFTEYFELNPTEHGWAVSSALLGCLIGALSAGYFSQKLGRKVSLVISALLFTLSALGSGAATSLTFLSISRIIGGIGVGIASLTAPMYIAELSPSSKRGQMVSFYQLAIVVGILIVFLATYFIGGGVSSNIMEGSDVHTYNVEKGWRMMFWSELIPCLMFLALLIPVPKSPRWLVMKDRGKEALEILLRIVPDKKEAHEEFLEIKKSIASELSQTSTSIWSKGMPFIVFIGVMLSIFQQVTGINAILYYGSEIFNKALGYGPEDALKQQILLGTVNLIFTFVAILTVDKWGRKPLLIVGTLGMTLGIGIMGWTIYTNNLGVLSLVGLLGFIASFAMSMGPIVWVMLSEIFPNRIRSTAMAIAVGAQWLANMVVQWLFPIVNEGQVNQEGFNGALPYFLFAGMGVLTILFVLKFIPETKGYSLEEMEEIFTGKKIVSKDYKLPPPPQGSEASHDKVA